jgi:hypothetical protein
MEMLRIVDRKVQMLEALKNGKLQVRKKFGLIGKRLEWIEDALCKQELQPNRLRVATERIGVCQKIHPIGWMLRKFF